MSDFASLVAAFARGDSSFEALDAALAEILTDNPGRAPEVEAALEAARKSGMEKHIYAALKGHMDLIVGEKGGSNTANWAERTRSQDAGPAEDKTLVLNAEDREPATAPVKGTLADNADRLEHDKESTEHTLISILGNDFTAAETQADGEATSLGDIFKKPFTDDEIAGADVTALQGLTETTFSEGEFGPGYMLRGRFQFTTKLGEGGMGAVWRARDMLKVRARDRKPYVAIKLLSGDFREHPEAFIALQRETSKQQRLAHPNVATVFDFDRDQSTNTVFMTMEVMEGQSMDKFINKLPKGGLSPSEAMPFIEQLGAGLSYAHQNGLVHSDLKPGNCFLTKEGVVKLLDFGIARASKTEAHADGEKTLFDPGKLGAMTPTYATVEMFEGMDPDPRDDIYAMAIMAYQFFTGKHPYGKQNAVKALSMGLTPPYVATLNKRQNRALARGLAFKREDRTPTVEELLEDLRPRQHPVAVYTGSAIAVLLVVGALAFNPVINLIESRENESIIRQIDSGGEEGIRQGVELIRALVSPEQKAAVLDDARTVAAFVTLISRADDSRIEDVLALIRGLDPRWRQELINAEPVKKSLFGIYEKRIDAAFDPAADKLDYATASAELEKLDELYPNSALVLTIKNNMSEKQRGLLARLEGNFEALLESGAIVPSDEEMDVSDTLEDIGRIAPQHPLLGDDRLRFRAIELAEQALDAKDPGAAQRYVAAGLHYAPGDERLMVLDRRTKAAVEQIENERIAADIEERLRAAQSRVFILEGFSGIQQDIVTLLVIEPGNKVAESLRERHQAVFQNAFNALLEKKRYAAAERLLAENAGLLDTAYLNTQRTLLSREPAGAGGVTAAGAESPARKAQLDSLARHVEEPDAATAWMVETIMLLRKLTATSAESDARLETMRADTAEFLLAQASLAASEERFDAAQMWIARARMASPASKTIDVVVRDVASAVTTAQQRRKREHAVAELESLEGRFASQITAGRADKAEALLLSIRTLTEGDPELGEQNRGFLAKAYADLGESYARNEDFPSAVRIAAAGVELNPDEKPLAEALSRYRRELDRRALLIALEKRFEGMTPVDVDTTRKDLTTLRQQFPYAYAEQTADFVKRRTAGLVAYAGAERFESRVLRARLEEITVLFPESSGEITQAVAVAALKRIEAERERDALTARMLLDEFIGVLPGEPQLQKLAQTLPPAPILQARKQIAAGRLNEASRGLKTAEATVGSLPEYEVLTRTIALQQKDASQKFETFVSGVKTGKLKSRTARKQAFDEVITLWSDNPEFRRVDYVNRKPGMCFADLAGSGKSKGGRCYDLIARGVKGPVMVVVPTDGAGAPAFAISRYEVSVARFNRYCEATAGCAAVSARNDKIPVTGISIGDARGYAKWLSARASANAGHAVVYRLPKDAEWRHAAAANGEVAKRGINCRPESGSSLSSGIVRSQEGTLSLGVPIGRALVSASFGGENGWGVVNAVGNAQEWVISGNGLAARGGAFEDPIAACSVDAGRPHSGGADAVTGFRLVRELG
jgi:serine/threonine protein kinase